MVSTNTELDTVCTYWDEPLNTALAALAQGVATVEQLEAAAESRRQERPAIGELALAERKLNMAQVMQILGEQAITGELFGKIAVRLNHLSTADVNALLHLQATLTPDLSDILVSQGVLTADQAEALRNDVRGQLRGVPGAGSPSHS